jgi:soluble lytic murein transglycosylase
MWERQYDLAVSFLDEAARKFPGTKDGREALAFKGACLVRLGKSVEGARAYEQYVTMYPTGERIESSYLNVIDAYREGGKEKDALAWVAKIRQRFPRTATETNAVFAQLRLQIGQKNWQQAINTADDLRRLTFAKGVMTNLDEATFLKAHALEKSGRKDEAINWYSAISDNLNSYYGGLATERLLNLVKDGDARRANVLNRQRNVKAAAISALNQYPALFQNDLLRETLPRRVDPRFVLAIMKQESSFKTNAKSPAAARGLLQMTVDTAAKYSMQAKMTVLQPEDLYKPGVNIALGSVYIAELQKQFPNLLEAVAASYNGGEDNAARWLRRADSKEPFIFTSEVGFAETKDYVFKVLTNYRVYKELYTEDLRRK